jgi:hypothetical protein
MSRSEVPRALTGSAAGGQARPEGAAACEAPRWFRAEPLPGALSDDDAQAEIRAIRQREKLSTREVRRLLAVEDERVWVALLEHPSLSRRTEPSRGMAALVAEGLLAKALTAPGLWNPLLDRLAMLPASDRHASTVSTVRQIAGLTARPRIREVDSARQVEAMVRGSASPLFLLHLAEAVRTEVWDAPSLCALVGKVPLLAPRVLQVSGDSLPPELHPLLLEALVAFVSQADARDQLDSRPGLQHPVSDPVHFRWMAARLFQDGSRLTHDQVRTIAGTRQYSTRTRGSRTPPRGWLPWIAAEMVVNHLLLTGDEQDMLALVDLSTSPSNILRVFQPDPGAFPVAETLRQQSVRALLTPRVLAAALERYPNSPDLWALASGDEALRWSPELRPALLRSQRLDVARAVIKDAEAEHFPALFRSLARRDEAGAVSVLASRADMALLTLVRGDLLPLLRSSNAEARLRAVALAPQLPTSRDPAQHGPGKPSPSAPSRPAR